MRPPRGPRPLVILLMDRQRAAREDTVHSRRRPHEEVQRATILLQSADGARTRHLAEALRVSDPTVRLWGRGWVQPPRSWRPRKPRPTTRPCAASSSRSYTMRPALDGRPRLPQSSSARSSPLPVKSPRLPTGR